MKPKFSTYTFVTEYADSDKNLLNTDFIEKYAAEEYDENWQKIFECNQAMYLEASRIAHVAIDRRYGIHRFFILIFSSIAVLVATLARFDLIDSLEKSAIVIPIFCMILSLVWYLWTDFLLRQSESRQNVLEQFEAVLPVRLYKSTNANIDIADHISFSYVERGMPILCGVLSLAVSAFMLYTWYSPITL